MDGFFDQGNHRLAFILPFKVSRLTVIATESGIPIFTHNWAKDATMADETLFSGMLHGIRAILNEAVHKGNVRQIEMDRGVLIIKRSPEYPVACVLVANKSAALLRRVLDAFAQRFFHEFAPYFTTMSAVDHFAKAALLIPETMPFIPEYD